MSEFTIEVMEDGKKNRFMVKQESTGWFYPNLSKLQAEELCEKLNEPFKPKETKSIEDYFNEWNNCIEELTEKEREKINLKESFSKLEEKILADAKKIKDETGEDIIKAKYGGNNDKTRKKYVEDELKEEKDKKNDLTLRIDYLKRRIDFLKELMRIEGILIDAGVLE